MKNSGRVLMTLCAIIAHVALSGCGGGGPAPGAPGSSALSSVSPAAVNVTPLASVGNSYALTEDGYGLQNATFMAATRSDASLILRAALAGSMTDPEFTTVFRIDIPQPAQLSVGTYAIGGSAGNIPRFPGEILFFNGHKSTLLNTVSGTISFTAFGTHSGNLIAGNFAVQVADQNSTLLPRPLYAVEGNFSFALDTYGALVPTPSPLPIAAAGYYNTKCASCHALGTYDPTGTGAPDLALKGGEMAAKFTADLPGHANLTLSASELHDLKVFLNAM
jgi:hypothetical protein